MSVEKQAATPKKPPLMFDTWKIQDFLKQKLQMLWIFIGILLVLLLLQWINIYGIKTQLQNQRLYITPANVVTGGYYQANQVSPAIVYGFGYQLFVAMNTWSTDAKDDYQKNIETYRYYLTPSYSAYLQQDYINSLNDGNLTDSTQTIAPFNGLGYDGEPGQVVQVSANTWIVDLKLRVTSYKDNTVLMDALYDYKVRVSRTAESIQFNSWGLALDGLVSRTLIKTFV